MKYGYEIEQSQLTMKDADDASILVYAEPSDEEKQELLQTLNLDKLTLESVLDPDEVPRVEVSPDWLLIIWKRPDNCSFQEQLKFEVSSIGIVVQPSRVTVILAEKTVPFGDKEFQRLTSLKDLTLRLLLQTIHHYLGHLKAIKSISRDLQSKLSTSMENKYLLQMFSLGEGLVYYHNALESNATVLAKIRGIAERTGFSKEEIELLDDLTIENQQACKQASIYTTVLSGLMDARGTIISNNMNVLLKNLTLINVVFLPLNLVAGILGMSEFSMMTQGGNWIISYGSFLLSMVFMGLFTWFWLIRVIDKGQTRIKKG